MNKRKVLFDYICYGGTMVKRVDFKLTEQSFKCPHAGDITGGFPACATCDGNMDGTVQIGITYK